MARTPFTSLNGGWFALASRAAVQTNPFKLGVAESGLLRFQSTWSSFHAGLGFSMHIEIIGQDATFGLSPPIVQSFGGNGYRGSQPGFVGAGPSSGAAPA